MSFGILLAWLIAAVIVDVLGADRQIGFKKALLISILLSPLIGVIFVATSPSLKSPLPSLPQDVQQLIAAGDKKFWARDYLAAPGDYQAVLVRQDQAPYTHFKISQIHSARERPAKAIDHLAKAVAQGFDNFSAIDNSGELAFMRDCDDFRRFIKNGCKLAAGTSSQSVDSVVLLKRLADLRQRGTLTDEEFEQQKRKLLSG